MPYPRWLAKVNKRIFNPREIKKGRYPVVTHVGRSSGTEYRTPMDAFPAKSGYVMVVRYGPESDWVQNVLTAGSASLHIDGEDHRLEAPTLIALDEARAELEIEEPSDFAKAEDFLLMADGT
ncbi:MAG: nitroreductase family deazaflavin-dependent oxidoreductase [Acidimicrobiia bacterium]